MGLFFTLVYIFVAYIGPQVLFGDLVQYHIQIGIAALALAFSLPSLQDSDFTKLPQTYGVIGLIAAVPLSIAFSGWFGGAPTALLNFLPEAMLFFFVVLNCKKKIHLQILIAVLLFTAVYNVSQGLIAERFGNDLSPYVIIMKNNAGESFYRIRGVDFISDPNDLAQFLLMLMPCLFFFWSKGKTVRNMLFVLLPLSFLLVGMFFTHSRGAMVALMAVAMVAGRRKFGLGRSLVAGVVLYLAMTAAGFSGGRSSSLEDGTDRMDSWAAGLMMIRMHPILGVGFGRFTDEYHDLPAHNSVVLCAAETGLFGLFFWMLVTVPTVRDAYVGSGSTKSNEAASDDTASNEKGRRKIAPRRSDAGPERKPALSFSRQPQPKEGFVLRGAVAAGAGPVDVPALAASGSSKVPQRYFAGPREDTDEMTAPEIHRMSNLMLISATGFLVAGWFLPRTYTMTMFLEAGIVAAIYNMGRREQIVPLPMPFSKAAKVATIAGVVCIGLVWISLRISHL